MKLGKRLVSLALALVMVFSLTVNASAATAENIQVQLSPNITVKYNGTIQNMADVNGTPVYPLLYGGTTYLPVRAVANMLGVNVGWDGATQTVILADLTGRTPIASTGSGGKKPAPSTVTVQLSPNITVRYNGAIQSMADVNGTAVYPLLYGGTTYLPVRAVANMLGVAVDWDGATQTVILGRASAFVPSDAIIINTKTIVSVALRPDDLTEENLRAALTETDATKDEIGIFVNSLKYAAMSSGLKGHAIKFTYDRTPFTNEYGTYNGRLTTDIATELEVNTSNKAIVDKFKTSEDAENLGENHIGYDHVEIDWSTANDGYARVRLNKQFGKFTRCTVVSYDSNYNQTTHKYILPVGKWSNIPLLEGSTEYFVTIQVTYRNEDIKGLSNEEWEKIVRPDLRVRFKAQIKDENAWLTMSTIKADYENAPNTCAKALELTENCKTDAEKVAAVFNWVSKNIKYDFGLGNEIEAHNAKLDAEQLNPVYDLFKDGTRDSIDPDAILASKSGVCEDFAVLTVAMLRSLGIPCKYVSGDYYNSSDKTWNPHGWVAVSSSVENLNAKTFHGWTDADGFVNIDPTNVVNVPERTSNASNYRAEAAY